MVLLTLPELNPWRTRVSNCFFWIDWLLNTRLCDRVSIFTIDLIDLTTGLLGCGNSCFTLFKWE